MESTHHKESPVQLTVRNVPRIVKLALVERAKKEGKSLNTVLVEVLSIATGLDNELHSDLDYLSGKWIKDSEFEKALEDQNKIDLELWK